MYISQRMSNLRNLHIIRGLAALYVALGHAKVVFWVGGREYIDKFPRSEWGIIDYLLFALDLFSSSAQEFVIVFFVLSGFFIAYSFDKNNWSWKGFYANRALRIYPPYIASAIFAVAVIFFINYYNNYLIYSRNTAAYKPAVGSIVP
jgi:peptidoglycan/LPS O-acetylase OafA/YrhL